MLVKNLFYFNPVKVSEIVSTEATLVSERVLNNFGDLLSPMIVRATLKYHGFCIDGEIIARKRLLAIGSILHYSKPGDVIWGSGVNGKIPRKLISGKDLDVRLLRGPLSRKVLMERGVPTPEKYGDPGLLLSHFLPALRHKIEAEEARNDYIVVPNYNDLHLYHEEPFLVDPTSTPQLILKRILGCKLVIASSLHALVVADSFGIGSRPLLSGAEAPFKYLDYYLGTGRENFIFAKSVQHAIKLGSVPPARFSVKDLLSTFPVDIFKNHSGE
jgi:pyruvyltransferase